VDHPLSDHFAGAPESFAMGVAGSKLEFGNDTRIPGAGSVEGRGCACGAAPFFLGNGMSDFSKKAMVYGVAGCLLGEGTVFFAPHAIENIECARVERYGCLPPAPDLYGRPHIEVSSLAAQFVQSGSMLMGSTATPVSSGANLSDLLKTYRTT
jgi:hypothetical protein